MGTYPVQCSVCSHEASADGKLNYSKLNYFTGLKGAQSMTRCGPGAGPTPSWNQIEQQKECSCNPLQTEGMHADGTQAQHGFGKSTWQYSTSAVIGTVRCCLQLVCTVMQRTDNGSCSITWCSCVSPVVVIINAFQLP
jgi:hypothetical protein